MPNWIEFRKGIFICTVCCYEAVFMSQGWTCANRHCENHVDLPVEQRTTTSVINSSSQVISTASSVSGTMTFISPSPSPEDTSTTTTT